MIFLSFFLLFLSFTPINGLFNDVPKSHWAYYEIQSLSDKHIFRGNHHQAMPNKTVSRLEAAIFLNRALKISAPSKPKIVPNDMNKKVNGYKDVVALINKGMFTLNKKKFEPNEPLTRKEMAQIFSVAFQLKGLGKTSFKDLGRKSSYYPYIDALTSRQFLSGYADGTFRPNAIVNRAQFALLLSKAYEKPFYYVVRQNNKTLHTVDNEHEAITLAMKYPNATVHPANHSLTQFSWRTSNLEKTDIRNGVLIYNGSERILSFRPDFFVPYITSDLDTHQNTLFDTFIILGIKYPNGNFGPVPSNRANYKEWKWYISQTFSDEGALRSLNNSARTTNKKVKVYISVPYPKQTGDIVDLKGNKYNNTLAERQKMITWYIQQVEKTWNDKKYSHLELKGFYWFSETMGYANDNLLVENTALFLDKKKKTFIYSPHATSSNFNKWKQYGFDGAYLQPNAFRLKFTKEEVEYRLHKAFLHAQIYGSGINIEIDQYGPLQIEEGLDNFRTYINFTHRYRTSGQSLIFYQGDGMIDRMVNYEELAYQKTYDLLSTLAY